VRLRREFPKACDERRALLAMADALGLGAGFGAWFSTLLCDTSATALFCGTLSTPHAFGDMT
jgi:hypothetical protein